MRVFVTLLLIYLVSCKKSITAEDRFVNFISKPSAQNALHCVATYSEFCTFYKYEEGQRNRQWINRIRVFTSKKLYSAIKDEILKTPQLKIASKFTSKKCKIKNRQISISFSSSKANLTLSIDSCVLSNSGRLLPSNIKISTAFSHPKEVK
jgi:hypothetical protein